MRLIRAVQPRSLGNVARGWGCPRPGLWTPRWTRITWLAMHQPRRRLRPPGAWRPGSEGRKTLHAAVADGHV